MMTTSYKGATKAVNTAAAALVAGDAVKARRALAYAGDVLGLGGVPELSSLDLCVELCRREIARREADKAEARALFARNGTLAG